MTDFSEKNQHEEEITAICNDAENLIVSILDLCSELASEGEDDKALEYIGNAESIARLFATNYDEDMFRPYLAQCEYLRHPLTRDDYDLVNAFKIARKYPENVLCKAIIATANKELDVEAIF